MTDLNLPVLPVLPGISLSSSQKIPPFPVSKTPVPIKKVKFVKSSIEIPHPKLILEEISVNVIDNNDLENELKEFGYHIINKIATPKLFFIKATNKKGQKVYIYIDTLEIPKNHDVMLIDDNNNLLSYSTKHGAYNCSGTDVSGIVFEYGTNSICTIMRAENDLKFAERNYLFNHNSQSHNLTFDGCVITYPVIKLSEIRVNPGLVLCNTDLVTRRLRNTEDSYERQELANTDCALDQLNEALCVFKQTCNNSTHKLMTNIQHLRECPEPSYNDLVKSNDDIIKLICVMKKVASKKKDIERLTYEIEELTQYLSCQI